MSDLKQIKFDPKHTSLTQLQKIIKRQAGYDLVLTRDNINVTRLVSRSDMIEHFALITPVFQSVRYALIRSNHTAKE